MIGDIFLSWNVLTVSMIAWLGVVTLLVAMDVGPEIVRSLFRKRKARARLTDTMFKLAEKKISKPIIETDATIQLGTFKIQPAPTSRGRHAKI